VRSPPSGSLSWMSWVKLRRPYSQWNTRKVTDTGKVICRMHPTYAINTLEPPLGHASPYVLNTLSVMRCRFRSKWCLSGIGGSRNTWKLKIRLPKKEFQLNFQESFFQVLASIFVLCLLEIIMSSTSMLHRYGVYFSHTSLGEEVKPETDSSNMEFISFADSFAV